MRRVIGCRESPDGGTRHVHFAGDNLPKDWQFVKDGKIPGSDPAMLKAAEVQQRLQMELTDILMDPAMDTVAAIRARVIEERDKILAEPSAPPGVEGM